MARQRKGDVVGAQGAVTGEPRTATVVAALPTSAMELDGERFLALAQRYPAILVNLIRIQSERLVIANARRVEHERGETVALLSSPALAATATRVAELAKRVSPRPVIWLDRRLSFAGTLTAADDLTDEHATVLLPGRARPRDDGAAARRSRPRGRAGRLGPRRRAAGHARAGVERGRRAGGGGADRR